MKAANETIQAAPVGDTLRIKSLLNDYHPINGTDEDGHTPLYFAFQRSHKHKEDTVGFLTDRGLYTILVI